MHLMKTLADGIAFAQKARELVKDCISLKVFLFCPSILSIISNSACNFSIGILISRVTESDW